MAGKRIALFLDGTWNTVADNTNVWRMKSLCRNDAEQVCYYSQGVGTDFGRRFGGGMFGYGLDDEVIRAYEWLSETHEDNDRIFIFGFSRGAFTARSVAGLVSKCGLLRPGSPVSLKQLYARYRRGSTERTILGLAHVPESQRTLEDRLLAKYSKAVPIWFQGVWDTVGALGVPFGHVPVISRSNYGFLETDLRINQTHAYHALAIDEHREAFAPTLWVKRTRAGVESYADRDIGHVEQRWFVGAHADVGGGYDNGLLAQPSLIWMIQKAQAHGLSFRQPVEWDGADVLGDVHDSFREMAWGIYRAAKFGRRFYRAIGVVDVEDGVTIKSINETIDGSVFERYRADEAYRPANLETWAREKHADIGQIKGTVRADDMAVVE